jgi:hypothetical protein
VRPDELERRLQERLDALGPAPRAELLRVLMLPDFDRADRIGEFGSYPGIRVERGEAQCLRLPTRSFQDEVRDRERSDYYGDDDDDPDADGSDHPTTLATISPRLACAKPLTRSWAGVAHGTPPPPEREPHPRRAADRM